MQMRRRVSHGGKRSDREKNVIHRPVGVVFTPDFPLEQSDVVQKVRERGEVERWEVGRGGRGLRTAK